MIIELIQKFLALWDKPMREEQRKFRKDHCLNKYECDDWRDDIFW